MVCGSVVMVVEQKCHYYADEIGGSGNGGGDTHRKWQGMEL